MFHQSFRVRLSLWNVAVLAAALLLVGALLAAGLGKGMQDAVDRDLLLRLRRFETGRPPDPRRRPGQPPPMFQQPGFQPIQYQPPPEGEGDGRRDPPAWAPEDERLDPLEREEDRAVAFLRPRYINLRGETLGPPAMHQPWDPATVNAGYSGERRYSTVSFAGERIRVLTGPWHPNQEIEGSVQVARPLGELDRLLGIQLQLLLVLCPLALVIAGAGALFLTERALRPVREVTQAAAGISAEDLSRRLTVTGQDELARLAQTFNAMIARIEAAFEQQRRFTADASHELRTPLARIKITTSAALAMDQTAEEYREALEVADRSVDGMSRLVEELLLLARVDAGQLPFDLRPLDVRDLANHARAAVIVPEGLTLITDLPLYPILIDGDLRHLERVLTNLLTNAFRHTPAGGTVAIRARPVGHEVEISVADTGEGIPPEHLPHVCERFYRVEASRTRSRRSGSGRAGGSGLGLSISRSLVEAHGGTLTVRSEVGRGTTVTLTFPLSPASALENVPGMLPANGDTPP